MALKIITAPAAEPIAIDEAKAHLRVADADDDLLISSLIAAARQGAEHMTGRALMGQTLELALDRFDGVIRLQRPPLIEIISVTYIDVEGATQTLAADAYQVDDYSEPACLRPAYGTAWPAARCQANAVTIRYRAGYANDAAVPAQIKSWMLLRIGMLYENRESVAAGVTLAELPFVDRLLDAYRIWGA